jgi:hypothetical protein
MHPLLKELAELVEDHYRFYEGIDVLSVIPELLDEYHMAMDCLRQIRVVLESNQSEGDKLIALDRLRALPRTPALGEKENAL